DCPPALRASHRLERYMPPAGQDSFYSSGFRKTLVELVLASPALCLAYERLIREVVGPRLASDFRAMRVEEDTDDEVFELFYQFPPTLRIQPARTTFFRREHRDAEYGHQPGELNFWLPLTDCMDGRATLWVESAPNEGDFHPLRLKLGEMARFYGTNCNHKAPPNDTDWTRFSLDFRVAPARCYDRSWSLHKKSFFIHEMRSCVLQPPPLMSRSSPRDSALSDAAARAVGDEAKCDAEQPESGLWLLLEVYLCCSTVLLLLLLLLLLSSSLLLLSLLLLLLYCLDLVL
ncbi:unnamed protein product, partial [Polarella glacialis]